MEMLKQKVFTLSEIKIEVTHDCLLNCNHCSSVAKVDSGRQIDWNSCDQILNEAKNLGAMEVAFSGGEPLLWKYIYDAILKTKNLGMTSYLYTTGNVPRAKQQMQKLKEAGLSRVMFSLFGATPIDHEKITNHKGSYEQTLDIANYCVRIGLETEFHFVPFSDTYKALIEIAAIAKSSNINRISVLRLVPQGRGSGKSDRQLNHTQNLELKSIIKKLRISGHDIRLGSPYNFIMLRQKPQCRSGIDRITVGPDLRVFPCDAFKHIPPEALGIKTEYSNLNDHSLQECWEKSPYLERVRSYLMDEMNAECRSCKKLRDCQSGCMAQKFYKYGQLIKGPDPMCLLKQQKEYIN